MTELLAGPNRRYSYPGMGFRVTVLSGIHNQRSERDSFRRGVTRIPILSVYSGGKTASAWSHLRPD